MLTKTALEELYELAKEYNSDVIYCEKHYESDEYGKNIRIKNRQNGDFVDKPTFESNDLHKRVQAIIDERYLTEPWNKFVKRDLIMTNEIFFPAVKISEDNIWNQGVLFCAKKFLRVPNLVYIHRMSEDSMIRIKRTSQQKINFWLNPVLLGLKSLDEMVNRYEFFRTNPAYRFILLKKFVNDRFNWTLRFAKTLNEDSIYSTIKEEFTGKLGEYDILISALCTVLYDEKISNKKELEIVTRPLAARVDFKLVPKTGIANFEVVSISDDKAQVIRSTWLSKDQIGYYFQSYAGKVKIVTKAITDGRFELNLRGIWVPNPDDKSKRIPYWIDYTKLIVNDKFIFDKLVPTWHDKPYRYTLDVKAGEEIRIQTEWLPHSDNRGDVSADITAIQEKSAAKDVLISDLRSELDSEKKAHSDDVELISKFSKYFTCRVDVILSSRDEGDVQILSMSDEKAFIKKCDWLPSEQSGYFIQSYVGKLDIIARADADGQINLALRGLDIRKSYDRSKRIPYWIDYTKFAVNEEIIFDKLTPIWHDKPYKYNVDVKAGEEFKIEVEWLPHRSDT